VVGRKQPCPGAAARATLGVLSRLQGQKQQPAGQPLRVEINLQASTRSVTFPVMALPALQRPPASAAAGHLDQRGDRGGPARRWLPCSPPHDYIASPLKVAVAGLGFGEKGSPACR